MPAHDNKVPFEAHVELLQLFIARRSTIVELIQGLLNAQQKPPQRLLDRALLAREFEDCFFAQPAITREHLLLRGQLQQAHWHEGFRPRAMPGIPNEMFDPADMMVRAFNVWRNTRWPGRNGRVRYAQTLFNLYVVRCLTLLDMRVCDAGAGLAGERLARLQQVLDTLWKSSPTDQPTLVRDVRWLVPVAQSPTTDDLSSYFEAARRFEECLPASDSLEVHKASVLMAGGHLRSQLRYFTMNGQSLDDSELILTTRGSNALDCAMTVQHLVPLLAAYRQAIQQGQAESRRELAAIICQGISVDPELYVNRLDLLGAYSVVAPLFVTWTGEKPVLTPAGQRHAELVRRYVALLEHVAPSLLEDCVQFRPAEGSYSPYGVMFGFSSNILEHMTLKALQADSESRFSLEDVFMGNADGVQRLEWIRGWRKLPHVPADVLKRYEYPQAFAEAIFGRIEQALRDRVADGGTRPGTGRLFIDRPHVASVPLEHVLSSDPQQVAAGKAQACDPARLLADRNEGMYLVDYETPGGKVAISKNVLTAVLGKGLDANLEALPAAAAETLQLLYPTLLGE